MHLTSLNVLSMAGSRTRGGSSARLVVNPRRRTITVYHSLTEITILTERDVLDGGDLIPDFQCRVSDVFG